MVLQKKYVKSQETPTVSFDYYDFASIIGYKTFYPCIDTDSNGFLSPEIIGSDLVSTTETAGGVREIDFDVEIKKPITVEGEVIANVPTGLNASNANIGNISRIDIYVKKVDVNNSESILASGSGSNMAAVANTLRRKHLLFVDTPKTRFVDGEKIRITVSHTTVEAAAGCKWAMGHDPLGRDSDSDGRSTPDGILWEWDEATYHVDSQSIIQIPFKADI